MSSDAEMLAATDSAAWPRWYTPRRLLAIFCCINCLNYLDRGAIASTGVLGHSPRQSKDDDDPPACDSDDGDADSSGVAGAFDLDNLEAGLLSSAFLVGLLASSLAFAHLAKRYNAFRLIGVGLLLWVLAVVGCAVAPNYGLFLAARMLLGAGEASFVSLAAPFIDDAAPATQRAKWLALFYVFLPTGYALGYAYGGLVVDVFGLHWRWAFGLEAVLMVPFVVLGFTSKPLPLRGSKNHLADGSTSNNKSSSGDGGSDGEDADADGVLQAAAAKTGKRGAAERRSGRGSGSLAELGADLAQLAARRPFMLLLLGQACYTFAIGTYGYWGPTGARDAFELCSADLIIGAITAVAGIVGTGLGGVALDRMGGGLVRALWLCGVTSAAGGVVCIVAFHMPSKGAFCAVLFAGELLVFASQGPINAATLWSVPVGLRGLGMAVVTSCLHVFGDVPAPPIMGRIQDGVHNWKTTMSIASLLYIPAGILWALGAIAARAGGYTGMHEQPAQQQAQEREALLPNGGNGADDQD